MAQCHPYGCVNTAGDPRQVLLNAHTDSFHYIASGVSCHCVDESADGVLVDSVIRGDCIPTHLEGCTPGKESQ